MEFRRFDDGSLRMDAMPTATQVNKAPLARDDIAVVLEVPNIVIDVLANDSDPDSHGLSRQTGPIPRLLSMGIW
jgi:hypothetical protein